MGSEMHRARRSPTAVACACAAALVALGILLAAVAVRAEDGVVISLGFDVDVAPPQPELVRNQDEVRFGAAIASSPDGESAIFYGGLHGDPSPGNVPRSDAWSFDGATWQPLCGIAGLPPCAPGPRMFHAMATGPTGVVLYGGSPTGVGEGAANVIREDAWVWNGTTWHLLCASCPPGPRAGAAMAGDGTHLLLFGGLDESPQAKNDTWSFDGEQWQLVGDGGADAPAPRFGASPVWDGERFVLFGGGVFLGEDGQPVAKGDTWAWNAEAWEKICSDDDPCGPSPRLFGGLADLASPDQARHGPCLSAAGASPTKPTRKPATARTTTMKATKTKTPAPGCRATPGSGTAAAGSSSARRGPAGRSARRRSSSPCCPSFPSSPCSPRATRPARRCSSPRAPRPGRAPFS